jgi:hypothetical protein
MTPLYRNTGVWTRSAAYFAVVAAAILWGCFELWRGAHAQGGEAQSDALFGVLFIGGGIYALWQIMAEWRDVIVALDRDEGGGLVATVWGPTGPKKISGEFSNWRYHVVVVGKTGQLPFIFVDNAAAQRPLRVDLRFKGDVSGLRTVAPEAVAEYERRRPMRK